MYELEFNNNVYTIPDDSLLILAISKALDNVNSNDNNIREKAHDYLKSCGIHIERIKHVECR